MDQVRTVIVGAGFAGIAMAERLQRAGDEDFVVLERADELGGTWRDNTYPGCACDVPSVLYSFSFAPNPDWSRTYSGRDEIQRYLRETVRHLALEPHLRLGTELVEARWDEECGRWQLRTSRGQSLSARFLVAAAGPLTEPRLPDVPGIASFGGPVLHTARWDHDVDLRGRRVALVGTGASAIQVAPHLQQEAAQLVVVQRTPPWVLPHRDRPIRRVERRLARALPATQRLRRAWAYWLRELLVPGFTRNGRTMRVIERLARRHLARSVTDPHLRARLTPGYRIGCKRILLSNDWYRTLQQPNVRVATSALQAVEPGAIRTADAARHEVDVLVLATGFEVTDVPLASCVRDGQGRTLAEHWHGSPRAWRGTMTAALPNCFLLVGPNTGLGHNSIVFMIESQVRLVVDAMRLADERDAQVVAVRPEAELEWDRHVQERMGGSVWTSGGCSSWYLDRRGDNRTLWPSWTWRFWLQTRRADPRALSFRGTRH